MQKQNLYNGKVLSFSIYNLKFKGQKIKREIIEHNGIAAILAFDENKILLVKQYRFPYGEILEIPAGIIETNESPKKCAKREFIEETGYKTNKISLLFKFNPSVGHSTETVHCFLATELKKIPNFHINEKEISSIVKIDFQKLLNMIKKGKIIDSKTICAVLYYSLIKNDFS